VTVEGDAAACAAFDAMDFAPLWHGDRDMAMFERLGLRAWRNQRRVVARGHGAT